MASQGLKDLGAPQTEMKKIVKSPSHCTREMH